MDKKKQGRSCLFAGIGLLVIALLGLFAFRYLSLRLQANTSPPQVLIHNPYNHQQVSLESGLFVHATARSDKGITRLELWADGQFIEAQDAPTTGPISPLVLQTRWQPSGAGTHEIIVRAYDSSGLEGIGSIIADAVSTGLLPEPEPLPEPDEADTADSAPEEEEIADSGGYSPPPPAGSGSAEPPDHAPAGPGAPPAEDPPLDPAAPTFEFGILQFLGILQAADFGEEAPDDSGLTVLKIEALALETGQDYDGVHCYFGLGSRTPSWYPDLDENQATDENFAPLGDQQWNIADYLAEPHGITTAWESGTSIPFEATCIGITNGGTVAVELGQLDLRIPPEHWDGVTRSAGTSAEGEYALSYRITRQELVEKGLDTSIPVPTNLRLNDRRQELEWDWDIGEDRSGAGVTGFMIYVNDVLVFAKGPGTARAARIPYTWFNPPCGTTYEFSIRAYKPPYPDGNYSEASEPLILPDPATPPRTDCAPEFVVEFHTLTTGDFPGDDRPNNWANLVGAIDGYFFANDQSVRFAGQNLSPNANFNLADLIYQSTGGMNRFVITPVEGENIRIGFDLARYRGWDGYDDFCTTGLYHDYSYSRLMGYGFFDETLVSYEEDGRKCQIHYTIRPMAGSSLGFGNPQSLPLPWLDVVGLSTNPATGNLDISIQNTGSALWANQNISMDFVYPDGRYRRGWTTPETALEVGETRVFGSPYSFGDPSTVCIVLDPQNRVTELYENTGAWASHADLRYCLPRPDLRITETIYDFGSNTLRVHLWNTGDRANDLGNGDVAFSQLSFLVTSLPGSDYHEFGPGIYGDGIIPNGGDAWIELSIRPQLREWMNEGYSVSVNPGELINETDFGNNTYFVRAGENLRLAWDGMFLRWYPNAFQECPNYGRWATNSVDVWIDVYARSTSGDRSLGSWHWDGRVGGEDIFDELYNWTIDSHTFDAYLNGEEDLIFKVRGKQSTHSMGSATGIFEADTNWGILNENIGASVQCDEADALDKGWSIDVYPDRSRWRPCGSWSVYVNICSVRSP